mmetsp:Transcript_2662/g.3879  ORF Transcript_2662/g.3879 Transcript_2662/m.3879 type:complete len:541 (-) Transcript_2662:266-1888(-)
MQPTSNCTSPSRAIDRFLGKKDGSSESLDPIPFNKPCFFPKNFESAMNRAATYGQFSGDGANSVICQQMMSDLFGYKHSLLTPSCTAALEMAALILDIHPGDEVIVPSFTFVTSASAFALRGARLIFADSSEHNPNVDTEDILRKVTPKTKAIVVVHYAGVPVDVKFLLDSTKYSIPIVEDCAHAISSIDPKSGDYVGKSGCLSCFSFHETKNICIGEGGLLVVNDESLWLRAQMVREKGTNRTDFKAGRVSFYTWVELGSSFLMSEVDAAMLCSALENIDEIQHQRLKVWDEYDQRITPSAAFVKPGKTMRANAHMYFLEFSDFYTRSHFCDYMRSKKIVAATHYLPLDSSPYAQRAQEKSAMPSLVCTNSERWSKTIVRLPLFVDIEQAELDRVINAVNSFAPVSLAPADECYWEDILEIRNENSECFTNADQIGKEEHWCFMAKHGQTYRVALREGRVVGFVGHVKRDVRLAVREEEKGSGVARFMCGAFVEEVGDLDVAVLPSNKRSLAFFRKLGYLPCSDHDGMKDAPIALAKRK